MTAYTVVKYQEHAYKDQVLGSPEPLFVGVEVEAKVVFRSGDHHQALVAVERLAEKLRVKIADDAERNHS